MPDGSEWEELGGRELEGGLGAAVRRGDAGTYRQWSDGIYRDTLERLAGARVATGERRPAT